MSSLAASPNSSVYGQPGPQQDALGIVNQLKDREMRDFQNKANFMSDLSLKQDRQRALFNPEDPNNQLGTSATNKQQGPQNTVIGHDPNQITGMQKAELSQRQQGMGLEQQKINQAGKLGEERVANQTKQEQLNQQKSDQIHQQKQDELTAKITEANGKLTQAQAALAAKGATAEQQLQSHKDLAAAMEERHKLELAQKDHEFQKSSDQHQQTIDNLTEQLKQKKNTSTTTTVNPEGTQRTTSTTRGGDEENDPLGIR